jgi:hypothetical protein
VTHYWFAYWLYGTTILLYEAAGEGNVERGSATVAGPASTDQLLGMSCIGETILVTLAGATIITYSSAASNKTVTNHGIYNISASVYIDDFKVTTV